jgi:hypothetical protein
LIEQEAFSLLKMRALWYAPDAISAPTACSAKAKLGRWR